MANYFATKTAQFKPFSYQEMLAPIMALKEDYEKTEKQLSDLEELAATQAFTFQGSAYENDYNKYIESLNNASNSMSVGNYNSDTKNQIKALRKQFLNTLAPAAQRITKLNTLRDKQNAEQANNPYIRFSTDYRNADEKDITANSNYTSYDLSKIYKQIAEDTLNRIATNYRPQVGDPINIEGTNSYIVKHGYGMTPEEYEDAISNPNSDLNKYINSEINKAVKGITNEDVIKEVTQGVKDVIKSNIGKFESTTVKSSNNSESNANFFRAAEAAYRYNWGTDSNGNPIILGESDQYKLDHGWKKDINGEWYKPSQSNTGNGTEPKKDTLDAYFDLKTMPSSEGGTVRIKSTDIDNKLRKESNKPDVTAKVKGKTKPGLKKFEWYELNQLGIKNMNADEIAYYTDNNIDNAKYYDYYYEDVEGRGGELHIIRKPDAEIEDIIVRDRTAEKRKEAAGITMKNGKYYFTDKNGKILLTPRRFGIQLDLKDESKYKNIIKDLKEGKFALLNGNTLPPNDPSLEQETLPSHQSNAEEVEVNV